MTTPKPPSRDVSRELFEEFLKKSRINLNERITLDDLQYSFYSGRNVGYEAAKGGGWMPIDSAPKDGTEVLVWANVASVAVVHLAWYRNAEEWERSGKYCGGWETLEEWEGWWTYPENSISQIKLEEWKSPTLWTPYIKPQEQL